MHIVISLHIKEGALNALIEKLGLSPQVSRTRLSSAQPFCSLDQEDRVLFLTDLSSGGMAYQLDLIQRNPGVDEWVVLSPGAEPDALSDFRSRLNTLSRVVLCATEEAAAAAFARRAPVPHTCVVVGLNPRADAEGLHEWLLKQRPLWKITLADAMPDEQQLLESGRVILVGERPEDFSHLNLPADFKPILVLTGMERNPRQFGDPANVRRQVCQAAGVSWSFAVMKDHIYLVSLPYERWRMQYQDASCTSLMNEETFVMWDEWNLPAPHSQYTPEGISRFLRQFDGCYQLQRTHLCDIT